MLHLPGKVAVVTGGSSGIGEATVRALARAGASVVAAARREERLAALASSLDSVEAFPADVTDDEQVLALATHVEERHGACHVLVNNAGANLGPHHLRSYDDVPAVVATMDVNFLGAVRCTAAFTDLLTSSAPSRVVNVCSMAGKLAAGEPAYTASKFALVGFTEALGLDWARRGIRVSQVNPGFVQTEGFPQERFTGTPFASLLGTVDAVADAIVTVARSGARERTVPRWYRPFTTLRHLVAPAYFTAIRYLR